MHLLLFLLQTFMKILARLQRIQVVNNSKTTLETSKPTQQKVIINHYFLHQLQTDSNISLSQNPYCFSPVNNAGPFHENCFIIKLNFHAFRHKNVLLHFGTKSFLTGPLNRENPIFERPNGESTNHDKIATIKPKKPVWWDNPRQGQMCAPFFGLHPPHISLGLRMRDPLVKGLSASFRFSRNNATGV